MNTCISAAIGEHLAVKVAQMPHSAVKMGSTQCFERELITAWCGSSAAAIAPLVAINTDTHLMSACLMEPALPFSEELTRLRDGKHMIVSTHKPIGGETPGRLALLETLNER